MANQRRTIWEIRFYALQEMLYRERENLVLKAGREALHDDEFADSVERDIIRSKIDHFDKIIGYAKSIEIRRGHMIFLERDLQ